MLILWRGKGLIACVILAASAILPLVAVVVLQDLFFDAAPRWLLPAGVIAGFAGGGMACLGLGRTWNRANSDEPMHSLYGIRVEHWGVLWLCAAGTLSLLGLAAALSNMGR